ncbi:hypothetical protein BH09VER1_BH09VER1_53700 [soil metagenome]
MKQDSNLRNSLLLLLALLALALPNAHAVTTGFNKTTGGPLDYNATGNWVGGTINGIWDPSLTLTANQTVTFAADTTLTTGLTIGYAGNFTLTLKSSGVADRTLTLGGDVTVNAPAAFTLGSTTAGSNLNINLGGATRTFTTTSGVAISNVISNGGLIKKGTAQLTLSGTNTYSGPTTVTAGILALNGGSIANSDVTVSGGTLSDGTVTGGGAFTHVASLTLIGAGEYKERASSTQVENITGALTIGSGQSFVTIDPPSGNYNGVTAASLVRADHGTVVFRGVGVGTNTIASQTSNSSNISFTTAPTGLVGGGGGAGTTTISILPWAIGGISTADAGTTFVTYTAANGIRPLTAAEYATTITSGATSTNNVKLTTTAASLTSNATINSLLLAGAGGVAGGKTLTLTSGALLATTTATITGNLAFGSAEGNVNTGAGQTLTVTGTVTGTGDLVKSGAGTLQLNGTNSSYGATFVNTGTLKAGATDAIGSSSAVTMSNVSGAALDITGFNTSIGSLTGGGTTGGNVTLGAATLTIGMNNTSPAAYAGVISGAGGQLAKAGTGTQTLSNANTYTGATTVNAGTLVLSGSGSVNTSSGIAVSAGAKFVNNSTVAVNAGLVTLAGSGTGSRAVLGGGSSFTGALTLDNIGDTLAPGNSPGIATFTSTQNWGAFSYDWETNNFVGTTVGTDYDTIAITGALTLSGGVGSYQLNLLSLTAGNTPGNVGGFTDQNQTWNILTTTTGISGFDSANWTLNTAGFTSSPAFTGNFSLGVVGNDLLLTYTVPEPATWALLAIAGTFLVTLRRRHSPVAR